jgi:hypothetical protein
MTALAVFGCSWAVGTGVQPADAFGARLSSKLSTTNFTNLGIAGSSNSRSVLQLLDYVNRTDISVENSIAVFLITTPARECVIIHDTIPFAPCPSRVVDITSGQTDALTQSWVKHFSDTPNHDFILHKNILSMQAICRQYKIQDYYIVGWSDVDLDLPGVNTDKIYHKSCVQLFGYKDSTDYADDLGKQSNTYFWHCGHPNELGHELIAQTLHDWIAKQSNVQS